MSARIRQTGSGILLAKTGGIWRYYWRHGGEHAGMMSAELRPGNFPAFYDAVGADRRDGDPV